jgi:antitoxin CptB
VNEKPRTLILKDRLRWRARRGMRELDEILGNYLLRCLDELDTKQLSALESFLEQNDMALLSWLTGKTQPRDKRFTEIVQNILGLEQ